MNSGLKVVRSDLRRVVQDGRRLYSAPVRWSATGWSAFMFFALAIAGCFVADDVVRQWFATQHNAMRDAVFSFGHWYGTGKPTLYIFASLYLVGIMFGIAIIREKGLLIAESYLLSGIVTIAVKSLLGRWRPDTGHGSLAFFPLTWGPNDHLSFPSGHATVAFALSSVIAGAYPHRWWQIFWYALAAITAVSRMYHDQHWLSDVLFSAILGTSVGVWLVKQHFQRSGGNLYVK
jgi:membrane-associated phospholipid phosphatase